MSHAARFCRAEAIVQEDLGDSLVLGDASGEHWLVLEGTATDVWRLLDQPRTLEDLATKLQERYHGDRSRILEDTGSLLDRLSEKGFVRSEADSAVAPPTGL